MQDALCCRVPFLNFPENWTLLLAVGVGRLGESRGHCGDIQKGHVGGFLEEGHCATSGLESKYSLSLDGGLGSYSGLYRPGRRVGLFWQGEVFLLVCFFIVVIIYFRC